MVLPKGKCFNGIALAGLVMTMIVAFLSQNYQHTDVLKFTSRYKNLPDPSTVADILGTKTKKAYLWYHEKPYDYIINQRCDVKHRGPFLLVVVISNPKDVKNRMDFRSTCGGVTEYLNLTIRTVFFVGKAGESKVEESIVNEGERYKDIVKVDLMDSYKNYTLKAILAMRWVLQHCPTANFILKCGQDVTVNYPGIVKYLTNLSDTRKRKLYLGKLYAPGGRVIRKIGHKWYQSPEEYGKKRYPAYIAGFASIYSFDAISQLHRASFSKNLFMEDAYFAELANERNITLQHHDGFWHSKNNYLRAIINDKCKMSKILATHHAPTGEICTAWQINLTKQWDC